MKPEAWRPGAVDAIATRSADGRRIVIKAVNYEAQPNTLLVRLQGSTVPERAAVRVYTLAAGLTDSPSLQEPRKIHPVETALPYARTLTIELKPHSVGVVAIVAD
jgi:alpha-N-arabinofuranosidase